MASIVQDWERQVCNHVCFGETAVAVLIRCIKTCFVEEINLVMIVTIPESESSVFFLWWQRGFSFQTTLYTPASGLSIGNQRKSKDG